MSTIQLITVDGLLLTTREQSCFGFLKNEDLFGTLCHRFGYPTDQIRAIRYCPNIGGVYKKEYIGWAEDYTDMLFEYLATLTVDSDRMVHKDERLGVTLDFTKHSGTFIMAVLSMIRYIAMYPLVVVDTIQFNNVLPFDKSLYLAHFLDFTPQSYIQHLMSNPREPVGNKIYQPKNHAVVNTDQMYKGGHRFLTEGLKRALALAPYDQTYSYGSIQGLVGGTKGEVLDVDCRCGTLEEIKMIGDKL